MNLIRNTIEDDHGELFWTDDDNAPSQIDSADIPNNIMELIKDERTEQIVREAKNAYFKCKQGVNFIEPPHGHSMLLSSFFRSGMSRSTARSMETEVMLKIEGCDEAGGACSASRF
jgi:hypothetical protein